MKTESKRRVITACELIALETFQPTIKVLESLWLNSVIDDAAYESIKEYYQEE